MAEAQDSLPTPLITALTCGAAVAFTLLWQEGNAFGAMRMNEDAIGPEPWRLISSILAHGGMLHLFFNVYWMWKFGRQLEARLSPPQVLGLFALTGLSSAAAQYAVGVGGIGLSGVVYGLAGFLWMTGRLREDFAEGLEPGTARFFVIWFFICILLSRTGLYPVANVAHGVGGVLGVAGGWAFASATPGPWLRWGATGTAFLLMLVSPRLVPIQWLATPDLFTRVGERIERRADVDPPQELVDLAQLALARADDERELWPGSDYFWYVSAYYKRELGQGEAAVREARRALELNPELEGPGSILISEQYNLALDALAEERYEEARELLRAVLALDERDLGTWEVLVEVHRRMGNDELADKAEQRAAALR